MNARSTFLKFAQVPGQDSRMEGVAWLRPGACCLCPGCVLAPGACGLAVARKRPSIDTGFLSIDTGSPETPETALFDPVSILTYGVSILSGFRP
jgi:hypothetical protein